MASSSQRFAVLAVAIVAVLVVMVADASALAVPSQQREQIVTTTETYTIGGGGQGDTIIVMPFYVGQGLGNFDPESVTVVIGVNNTITWINEDQTAEHDIQFESAPPGATVPFYPTQPLAYGDAYSITLTVPGAYSYQCEFHFWMQGTIYVKAQS